MNPSYSVKTEIEAWQSLVHVSRRWRRLVLGSPRRLNLRLFCTPGTPARDTLDVWPALPLIVSGITDESLSGMDNVIAALGQSNCVCQVFLDLAGWQFEKVLASMQVSFPELVRMQLWSHDETPPVIPDSFLDGSAHVWNTSPCMAFHFQDCQTCFCRLITLSTLRSPIFLIPGTFHPKRWSPPFALCPASKYFPLDSNHLDLTLTGKAEVCLHRNALSSPLSIFSFSKELSNISRTS